MALLTGLSVAALSGQTAENVLVVVNQSSNVSRHIGEYYIHKRQIPLANLCRIKTTAAEEISRAIYDAEIERSVARCLQSHELAEKILYIATTLGVPLKIKGAGEGMATEAASVDSELTLLYTKLKGAPVDLAGPLPNPFYRQMKARFQHRQFPIYLVTRLAGYDFPDVAAIIDRSLQARNRGKFVFDLKASDHDGGNDWLQEAARALPKDRVVLEDTSRVLYSQREVIGYASWGSNDHDRNQRMLGFSWLPGAIATEFVSTDGRTFARPPDGWNITTWEDRAHFFAGSPQTLTADYIHEGATGCSGHVYEPYLAATPHPQYLFPAYFNGRNLAESYYLSIPSLSWQNIVVGDPLCKIGKPE
ncbi:MAG TPA: TIGR03790 family protein [Bryobacteraceae bacterium]|nr:TIGR03790 family protein [Bryobacteraceae bacterium]